MNLKPQDCIVFDGAQDMMILSSIISKKRKRRRGERWAVSAVYPLKQRVFEALAPGTVPGHPAPTGLAASACCCSGMVTTTVSTITPNNANVATIAIMAIDAFLSCSLDEWFILLIN